MIATHAHTQYTQTNLVVDQVGQRTAGDFFLTPLDPTPASLLAYLAAA